MKLIILDRDGVINEDSDHYIRTPEEWHPIPGSLDAIARLNQAGYTVVVITNQSAVGRKYCSEETLKNIHDKMNTLLEEHNGHIDKLYYCPHTPDDHCSCRKPKIGLFEQVSHDYQIDLHAVINIGDSLRDIQAGIKMRCKNFLVKTGKGMKTFSDLENLNYKDKIPAFDNLASAVDFILKM